VGLGAFAQKPEGVFKKASVDPVLDGDIDAVWDEANQYNVDQDFVGDANDATVGAVGETYWKGLWTETGVFVLLVVNDDNFWPYYAVDPAGTDYMYDKPEVYWDCNSGELEDGIGAQNAGNGHWQIAPNFTDGGNDGTPIESTAGTQAYTYSYKVNNPDYVCEYYFPNDFFKDKYGGVNSLVDELGFDVYVIDKDDYDDPGIRKRIVWANVGTVGESWANMNDAGIVTFEAKSSIEITSITLTGGEITENNGTLQIVAEILPADATNQTLKWTVSSVDGGRATIDSKGVLTGVLDGTVTVLAEALDGSLEDAEVDVTISNQIVTKGELNVIKNPNFDLVNDDGTATYYGGWSNFSDPMPQVIDGVAVLTPNTVDETTPTVWHYQYNQQYLTAQPDIAYQFSFIAKADATRTFNVDFEDTSANGYNRYGATTDSRSADGRSDWTFDITGEWVRYTFDVTFDQMVETTIQKVQFMPGASSESVYLDSLELIAVDDMGLITEGYVPVTEISVTGADGATSVDVGGTLQMNASVLPAEATLTDVRWSVENGDGEATIDENGVLSGVSRGDVTVTATAKDDSKVFNNMVVTVNWATGVDQNSLKSLNLCPNPAVDQLVVELPTENSVVSIYNSVGQLIEEVFVNGDQYIFDVSSFEKGIYIVKSGDVVAKFIK